MLTKKRLIVALHTLISGDQSFERERGNLWNNEVNSDLTAVLNHFKIIVCSEEITKAASSV